MKICLLKNIGNLIFTTLILFGLARPGFAQSWQFGDDLPVNYIPVYGESANYTYNGQRYDFDQNDGLWRRVIHQYPYAAAPNGCSSLGAITENFGSADFRPACNNHDRCYYDPNLNNYNPGNCNQDFLAQMLEACSNAYDIRIKTCSEWKLEISISSQKLKCIGYAEIEIPTSLAIGQILTAAFPGFSSVSIPSVPTPKEACDFVATAMWVATTGASAGINYDQFFNHNLDYTNVYDHARSKQAAYEQWMTLDVNSTIENSIVNIIHPTFQKYFGRNANTEEVDESVALLNGGFSALQYDAFVYDKQQLAINEVLWDAWGLCIRTCPLPLYTREPDIEEITVVKSAIQNGHTHESARDIYRNYVSNNIKAFVTKFYNRPIEDSYLDSRDFFGLLVTRNVDSVAGEYVKEDIKFLHSLIGVNTDNWNAVLMESNLKQAVSDGYDIYSGKVLGPIITTTVIVPLVLLN